MRAVSLIEPLEDRIAPAVVTPVTIAPNGKSASYKDAAGDTFMVTTTKGTFTSAMFTFDPSTQGQLTELALTGSNAFTGANIAFSVIPAVGGTDAVNIGYIDAIGLNLGSVTVPGDLGRIDVGGGATSMALAKLTVNSLGAQLSTVTQAGLSASFPAATESNITGTIGKVNVAGDVDGWLNAVDYKSKPGTGNIQSLNIGGSLNGNHGVSNSLTGFGEVSFTGTLGTAVIGGGIEGGQNSSSGSIAGSYATFSKIGTVTVKGTVPDDPNPNPDPSVVGTSILGGSGVSSGGISATTIGTVVVAGDIFGGTGTASGVVQAGIKLGNVTVGGSLIGGNFVAGTPSGANSAGTIFGGAIGNVVIGKNIIGGSGLNSGDVLSTGLISKVTVMGDVDGGSAGGASSGLAGVIKGQSLGTVVIDGSLIGGNFVTGDTNQTGAVDGAVLSNTTIGSVAIAKNIVGGSGPSSGLVSTAGGTLGKLTIGDGGLADGNITGGSGASSGTVSIDGLLGSVALTNNITGGSGNGSGAISINGGINSLKMGGNVVGGTADDTGEIVVLGLLKSANIGGDITGSSSGATKLTNTGYVQANGIGTMTVLGALTAGTAGAGGLDTSGAIRSSISIESLTIGSVVGNSTNPAIISAVGQGNLTGKAKTDVAISSLKITTTTYGDILAGYNADTQNGAAPLGTGVNADAQIGTVMIGTLDTTNIVAGVGPGGTGFGTAGSAALSGAGVSDLPTIISKISKVVILSVDANAGTYGIAAQYIASATVAGAKLVSPKLKAGADNDTFAAGLEHNLLTTLPVTATNVFLYEV